MINRQVRQFYIDKENVDHSITDRLISGGYVQPAGGYILNAKRSGVKEPSQYWHFLQRGIHQALPIQCKVALTIKEAAEYSNIGINKLESLLRSPRCPFVLYVGKKKLVKRKEFEKFISDNVEI